MQKYYAPPEEDEYDDYHDLDVSKAAVIRGKVGLEICKFFTLRLHSDLAFRVVEKCPEKILPYLISRLPYK